MTLNEELAQSQFNRKYIVTSYMKELKELYQVIIKHETAYGPDVMAMPDYAHREVMAAVARASEINTHIPALKQSFDLDNSFKTVESEIDIMLHGQ